MSERLDMKKPYAQEVPLSTLERFVSSFVKSYYGEIDKKLYLAGKYNMGVLT